MWKRSWYPLLILSAALLAPSAQALGGIMAGRWSPMGREPETVTVSFNSDRKGQGTMHITLGREGERFKGTYLRLGADAPRNRLSLIYGAWTSSAFDGFESGPYGSGWVREEITIQSFQRRYSGEVVASLAGDRGNSVRCRFRVRRPDLGLPGGATGRCQVTDGSTIEVGSPSTGAPPES
jgi:hypothetical protein